jgi:acetyl esterase
LISVNYRLAPENPYPAAVEDCYFALCWAVENADRLGIDASRIAIGGDSAGGTLTAATTLMVRDKGGPSLRFQYIIYPSLDTDFNTDSYLTNTHDPFFSREKSIYNWKTYLEDKLDTKDPYAVPMRATDLSNLPPAYILTAEHDCLLDDGERYGERLARAGVPTVVRRAPGTIHGFLRARFLSKVAEEELENLCMAIREALDLP